MKKGLIAFAEHEFRRALRLEPNLLDGYLGLGSALAQYAPPKNSLAMFEKAAKLA
jgi:Tfp pilus assembly protein PilF